MPTNKDHYILRDKKNICIFLIINIKYTMNLDKIRKSITKHNLISKEREKSIKHNSNTL